MPAQIEIRGQRFNITDIQNLAIDWDKESEVQHLSITLFDGQVFDFFEDEISNPWDGELYSIKRSFAKLTGG